VKGFFRPPFEHQNPGLVNAGVTVHANVCSLCIVWRFPSSVSESELSHGIWSC
jgi:hypothetical protein